MLVARNITRRFGRLVALDAVDFDARPGEIHALLGENGAGKTTLMNILAGRLRPDGGSVELFGRPLRAGSPAAALAAGVAAVHQSPMLFERMTWEENLALGGFDAAGARLNLEKVAGRAGELAARLGFALPEPGARIEGRTMTERVRLEVLRALSFAPRVLILDEPTGLLAPGELAAFLEMLRRLRGEGRIVILVTHKLAEALAVADRITVLRRGRVSARRAAGEVTETELARLMIGELGAADDSARHPGAPGAAALVLEALVVERDGRRALDGVSLAVNAGEIVGIAGVDGNGQSELVEALAGTRRAAAGRIQVSAGASAETDGTDNAGATALAVIPENRDLDGLILDMTLWENLLLAPALMKRAARGAGWLSATRAVELCAALLARFRIRAAGPDACARELSGGNRQRLCVARALESRPRVLVAHNVTRGLDLRATAEVHRMLADFAAAGGAVLLISSDLDELLSRCGRLAVISRGRLRPLGAAERDPVRLGLLMAGAW
ncbi:MAG TPA: ATP-binding cassette domain-containing protein [Candidatus Binataceae bacterium]|nr:ATP-binding cassette domain-containing protein [Candidatus Binataceae bacterium]